MLPAQPTRGNALTRRVKTLKGRFFWQAGLILLLASIMTFMGATSLNKANNDLNTINSGSIPSVNYAQTISQLISSIDAQAADYLATADLTDTTQCTITDNTDTPMLTVHDCDERNIDAETVQINEQLFNAAHNATYPGEQTALERITTGLESYLGDIHQMRVDYGLAKSKADPTDPSLQQAYQAYLASSTILHDQISLPQVTTDHIPFNPESGVSSLPACQSADGSVRYSPSQWTQSSLTVALDCLSDINNTALGKANRDANNFLSGSFWALVFWGLLLCGLLAFSTVYMMAATHRLVNPGLLPAVLIAIILSFNLFGFVGNLDKQSNNHQTLQDGAFQQMVADDYQSVYDATLLKRFATDANADESRWLIAQEFNDQPNIQHWQQDWNTNVVRVQSLMQNANANQTWDEEVQPLKDIDTYWKQYYALDGQIRTAENNQGDPNHTLTAEKLSTGESNLAFGYFTTAVQQLSNANQLHYNSTLSDTSSSLILYFVLSLVLFPLIGLLGAGGIWLRLKDF
jgi:hypothetical protein